MPEPLQFYQRTLKLPCQDLESGRAHQAEIDRQIKRAATSLAGRIRGLECEWESDESGHLVGTLKSGAYLVSLQTQFGRNVAFNAGQRQALVSYGISAEGRLPALDRAADSAQSLELGLKIAGGTAGAVLFFWLVEVFMKSMHHVIIPGHMFVALSLICGAWVGGKLGAGWGAALESRALRRSEQTGDLSQADSFWAGLTQKLELIAENYERI